MCFNLKLRDAKLTSVFTTRKIYDRICLARGNQEGACISQIAKFSGKTKVYFLGKKLVSHGNNNEF